ncbi:DNA adenine methylase [Spiroplasma endosymbiont of Labia minor]|uniref:DNA adenine methylase n=1 Tax=Spiroplasma endosymbiont of Labia minor TaxID=3066305 RepID=UPI0030CFCBB4
MQFISPISWVGGKTKADKFIASFFPKKIGKYIECFAGSCAVGLRLLIENRITGYTIFNDLNQDLITFWNDVKNNNIINQYPKFKTEEEAKEIYSTIPKKNKLGWQMLLQNRLSFSGKENSTFSTTRYNLKYFDCLTRVKFCEELFKQNDVTFTNLDYKKIIALNDSSETLFYLDPPYFIPNIKDLYKHYEFDFNELLAILEKVKGKFILSLNDCDYTRNLFKQFHIITWEKRYDFRGKNKNKLGKELLITNFVTKIKYKQITLFN